MTISNKNENRQVDTTNSQYGKTGKLSARSKSIAIDGIVYDGIREAGRILNIKYNTIINRLQNTRYPEYQYLEE